jgi:hypothetical protein
LHGATQIGLATDLAKLYLAANGPEFIDLVDTYVLLGDPALRLHVAQGVFFPLVIFVKNLFP